MKKKKGNKAFSTSGTSINGVRVFEYILIIAGIIVSFLYTNTYIFLFTLFLSFVCIQILNLMDYLRQKRELEFEKVIKENAKK